MQSVSASSTWTRTRSELGYDSKAMIEWIEMLYRFDFATRKEK